MGASASGGPGSPLRWEPDGAVRRVVPRRVPGGPSVAGLPPLLPPSIVCVAGSVLVQHWARHCSSNGRTRGGGVWDFTFSE